MAFGLIVAGGRGDRLGGDGPKFEAALAGKPMVAYSLAAFQRAECIEAVVLVVPRDRLEAWTVERLAVEGTDKVKAVTPGGSTRQESVRRGLELLPGSGEVVIHDAARPLVTPGLIEGTCGLLAESPGAVAAVPVTDTLKEVVDGDAVRTVGRERLYEVQTPQAFRLDLLKDAHLRALSDGFHATDDASLMERLGHRVKVLESDRYNLKVTYPADLEVAGFILAERGRA